MAWKNGESAINAHRTSNGRNPRPRKQKRKPKRRLPPEVLSPEEIAAMMDACADTPAGIRNHALISSVDRQLILRRIQSENPEIASLPEEFATRWANEFANVTEEAFRAGHTEQAAFMRLMLLDDDNGRLDTAQAIRTITQSVFKDTNDPSLIAQEYVQAERRQAEQISLFIPRIRSELDNKITEVS